MFRSIYALALAACLLVLPTAGAEDNVPPRPLGVVELFTSQGCNSCPPADEALVRLAARDDVIALGYHVDYWDYLGWKDTLGSKENSERQYSYAHALKRRGVYTPQAIINGRSHINGGHHSAILTSLDEFEAAGKGMSVDLAVRDLGDRMRVSAANATKTESEVHLVIVYFQRHANIAITRGENAGKEIEYVNAVTDIQTLGMWSGSAVTVDIPKSELAAKNADGCAVLLQEATKDGDPGAIIGAAILPRQST